MPRVKLTTGRSGYLDGKSYTQDPGEEIEVGTEEAKALIASGQAVPVQEKRRKQTRKPANLEARTDGEKMEADDGAGQ